MSEAVSDPNRKDVFNSRNITEGLEKVTIMIGDRRYPLISVAVESAKEGDAIIVISNGEELQGTVDDYVKIPLAHPLFSVCDVLLQAKYDQRRIDNDLLDRMRKTIEDFVNNV